MGKPKTEEGRLKKDCEDYLKVLYKLELIYYDRLNSGSLVSTGGGYRRRVKLCRPGTYDFFILYHQLYYIELKAPGKKPTPEQKAFKEEVERHGALCYWFDNFDSFYGFLQELIKEEIPSPVISRSSKALKIEDMTPLEGF